MDAMLESNMRQRQKKSSKKKHHTIKRSCSQDGLCCSGQQINQLKIALWCVEHQKPHYKEVM